jgi:hypothetical protein
LLDKADYESYKAWASGDAPLTFCPFKQAIFVFAAREMAMVVDGGVAPAVRFPL